MLTARRLIVLSAFVYTQFFWTRTLGILPQAANWIDDVVVLLLGVLALTSVPQPVRLKHTWAWALAAFVALGVVSAFANGVPWWRAALGFRGVLIYVPLYYAVVVARLDETDVWRVVRALVVVVLLQVPVQIVEFWLGIRRNGLSFEALADIAPGTLGPGLSNGLGFLYLPFICGSFACLLARRQRRWVVLGMLLTLGLILSSARAATLLLPVCFVVTAALVRGAAAFSRRNLLALGAVLLVSGGLADVYFRVVNGSTLLDNMSPVGLIKGQLAYSPTSASRLAYYPVTWGVLNSVAASPWIGLGPGNYASGAGYLTNSPGLNIIRDVFGQFETDRETALNSQFLASLGEFGILGIVLFFTVILALGLRTLAVRRATSDPSERAVLAALLVGQWVFLVAAFAEYSWEAQPLSYTFWLGSALVTKLARTRLQDSPEHPQVVSAEP